MTIHDSVHEAVEAIDRARSLRNVTEGLVADAAALGAKTVRRSFVGRAVGGVRQTIAGIYLDDIRKRDVSAGGVRAIEAVIASIIRKRISHARGSAGLRDPRLPMAIEVAASSIVDEILDGIVSTMDSRRGKIAALISKNK